METLTLAETATKIGVTKKCIRYHLGRGALQGEKDETGEWRIWASSVDGFVEQRNKTGDACPRQKSIVMKPVADASEAAQGHVVKIVEHYNKALDEKNDEIKNLYSRIGWLESQLRLLEEAKAPSPGEHRENQESVWVGNKPDKPVREGVPSAVLLQHKIESLAEENKRLKLESRMRRRWGILYPLAAALGLKE